jgi:hypothetical protein
MRCALSGLKNTNSSNMFQGQLIIPSLLNRRLKYFNCLGYKSGVGMFFKTLAKLASRPAFLLTKTENNWPKI